MWIENNHYEYSPGGDTSLEIPEDNSTVIITFIPATEELSYDIQDPSSILDSFEDAAEIIDAEYYSLSGAELAGEPENGMFIVKVFKSNGTAQTKTMMK